MQDSETSCDSESPWGIWAWWEIHINIIICDSYNLAPILSTLFKRKATYFVQPHSLEVTKTKGPLSRSKLRNVLENKFMMTIGIKEFIFKHTLQPAHAEGCFYLLYWMLLGWAERKSFLLTLSLPHKWENPSGFSYACIQGLSYQSKRSSRKPQLSKLIIWHISTKEYFFLI